MKCFKCSEQIFKKQKIEFASEVKGEVIEVDILSNVCQNCNSPFLGEDQVNELRRATIDKYRENHKLLTSLQIIQFRQAFGMSQKDFARYLGVGIASIKRWETYYIQDSSQNDLIILKCDPIRAKLNLLKLRTRFSNPNIFNGMKLFSLELFKNALLFFLKPTQSNISLLAQLIFYADFYNYKKTQKSITGTQYVAHKEGPCPDEYMVLLKIFENERSIAHNQKGDSIYTANCEPDLSLFDDSETKSLQHVCAVHEKKNQCITTLSKNENAYRNTKDFSYISYDLSADLLI